MSSLDQRRQSLPDLRRQLSVTLEQAEAASKGRDVRKYDQHMREADRLTGLIEQETSRRSTVVSGARPGYSGEKSKFANLGEFLVAVARHYGGSGTDSRLVRAPIGAGESDPSAGGFLVDTEFANTVLTRVYEMGDVVGRAFKLPITTGNGIKVPAVDETSRATGSRWGGVQAYWVGEGDAATATRPKFRLIELDLKKLMAIWYVTDELMADATALASIANEAFAEELLFMVENSMINGTGSGQPLGILQAPALVTVPKEAGQATQTLLYQNVVKMWSRMWNRSRRNAAWFINQDVEPQLYALSLIMGTAGAPVYMPPGGISEAPFASLFGRPVIPLEYCSTLGTPGDIILSDFSQYVLAEKAVMQAASSMHVRFLTDEMTFRLTWRIDGEPIWQAPLTPFQGSNTKSPFVALAAR